MNFAVIRESTACDRRVALTPPVVRRLVENGHTVWVETGAGDGAMFRDPEYLRAGAQIVYSPGEAIQRADLLAKISVPRMPELKLCRQGMAVMAFFHMAVAERRVFQALIDGGITAIGCEIVQTDDGKLPVLAPISHIAGQMTISIAAHLLRSSSGGRGILLGGSPGLSPAHVVILGAGAVGSSAARTAAATGARVTVLDIDPLKLRHLSEHVPNVATALADCDSVAAAVAAADVLIGAVLVPGGRAPRVVTRAMVESMQPGAAILDVCIDQGGCVETSRPTTIAESTFTYHGVTHFCVPNFTADLGRTASVAIAQAMLPYLLAIGKEGVEGAIRQQRELQRGVYMHRGELAEAWRA